MAKKRVIAFFMHETEQAAANREIQGGKSTDSYVMGEIDENRINALEADGLIIQELPPVPAPATLPLEELHGVPRAIAHRNFIARAAGAAAAASPAIAGLPGFERTVGPTDARAPDLLQPQYFFLWLEGPLLEEWRAQLDGLGVELLETYPTGAYKVRLEPAQVAPVSNLPFVTQLRVFDAEDTGPDFVTRGVEPAGPPANAGRAMLCFDIRLHRAEDATKVKEWLSNHNVAIAGATARKIRVYLLEDAPELSDIPALPEVASFEEYVAPTLHNDRARVLLGIDHNPATGIQQTGAGQIVAVADTGLDDQHPDFQGRIVGIVALGRPTDYSDPHGHGTHVAGSILGDGTASAGALCGTAPGAQLFFQSLLDAQGGLGGLPLDLGDLFDEAYRNGARIHNNSWGSATSSRYTINASEVDDFVANHRDMLIVISAGNEGNAADPRTNSALGFVDWLSIGSPASCKNALTVGASRSDRTANGYATLTYGNAWPNHFPDPPVANDKVSGDPQSLAAFSSRGPCDDRRIKPDVVAPGTDIASTKSSRAPLSHFWSAYPGNAQYAFMGGTSMAAPLVSGCAALVREYFVTTRNHQPSAALLKATLINGTTWLSGTDSIAPAIGTPNYHQGFGRINLADTIPNATRPQVQLRFVDDWQTPAQSFTMTGQRKRYQFSIAAPAGPLRICLAYTDLAMRALQNDLNLFLQLPSGQKMFGNAQVSDSLHIPDPANNVEIIRVDHPVAGPYLIQVAATNLLRGPQDFALIVTGEGVSDLTPI
jgi:subtilisin family serine protease